MNWRSRDHGNIGVVRPIRLQVGVLTCQSIRWTNMVFARTCHDYVFKVRVDHFRRAFLTFRCDIRLPHCNVPSAKAYAVASGSSGHAPRPCANHRGKSKPYNWVLAKDHRALALVSAGAKGLCSQPVPFCWLYTSREIRTTIDDQADPC